MIFEKEKYFSCAPYTASNVRADVNGNLEMWKESVLLLARTEHRESRSLHLVLPTSGLASQAKDPNAIVGKNLS